MKNPRKIVFYIAFLPAIIVNLIIFSLSIQPGGASTQVTGAISSTIANSLDIDPGTSEGTLHDIGGINIERINLFIRSMAHVIAFGGLGLMIILGCVCNHFSKIHCTVLTLIWGCSAAFIDEAIKLFVPGRHFAWIDAGKDVVGIVLALIGSWILLMIYNAFMHHRAKKANTTSAL